MREKCGYRNMHWYSEGETCMCGQIPTDIFFAANCTCGGWKMRKPVHSPDCAYVQWAEKRNAWLKEHQEISPPLDPARVKVS